MAHQQINVEELNEFSACCKVLEEGFWTVDDRFRIPTFISSRGVRND